MTWLKREWTALYSSHRKWSVMLLVFLSTLVDTSLVHGQALRWTQIIIVGLGAAGVRAVPNLPAVPTQDPPPGD